MNDTPPPNLTPQDKVILFDGLCKLCNSSSRFIIRFDKKHVFKLCSVQSAEGQIILNWFGYPTDKFQTMLLVENGMVFEKSDAVIRIVSQLPSPWSLLRALHYVPKSFRDWFYDRVALNRYKIFGKYEQCVLATPDHESRFLK